MRPSETRIQPPRPRAPGAPAGSSADATDGVCEACRGALVDGECANTVCRLPDREFSRLYTVSEQAEETWDLVHRFKYGGEKHLADELARMLVDHLRAQRAELERFDLFTSIALYIGPEAHRLWDYLAVILEAAQRIDDDWPFVADVITKVRPTGRFLGIGVEKRLAIAEGELREALHVPDPGLVAGRRVLLVDDAFSEGFTMREMARALRRAGAVEVAGLVFVRRKGT